MLFANVYIMLFIASVALFRQCVCVCVCIVADNKEHFLKSPEFCTETDQYVHQ